MTFRISIILLLLGMTVPNGFAESDFKIVTVVGAGGTESYSELFKNVESMWKSAAEKSRVEYESIGPGTHVKPFREQLEEALKKEKAPELWVVLIGHGTFDGRTAKFNLEGPDFTDEEFASWLSDYKGRLSVINTASASGSYIPLLAGPDRVVITATKNQSEVYFTRFGFFFAEAITGLPDSDLDNDEQISLLEAFIHASRRTEDFYESEGRLATEHALLEDSGDGIGSRAEWYEGVTPTQTPGEGKDPDGELASQRVLVKSAFERQLNPTQRQERDALEREVRKLRREKDSMDENEYYSRLEEFLLKLAQIYQKAENSKAGWID